MLARDLARPADADIHVDHSLEEAEARFAHFGRDRLLVIDADEVVGTLHRDDLCREDVSADSDLWRALTVQEVMCAGAMTSIAADAPAAELRKLLESNAFVLVLDEDRHVVGIAERGTEVPEGAAGDPAHENESGTGGRAVEAEGGGRQVYDVRPRLRRQHE